MPPSPVYEAKLAEWAALLPSDDVGRAIVAAAREEFVRFGFRRAKMDAIAEQAGVSRVTVHRRFEGKAQLLRAVILSDIAVFTAKFDDFVNRDEPLRERLTELMVFSVGQLRQHPLLRTLLETDAAQSLQLVTLEGQAEFELIRDQLALRLAHLMDAGEIARRNPTALSEFLLRLNYTVVLMPYGLLPGESEADIRQLVDDYLLPLLVG